MDLLEDLLDFTIDYVFCPWLSPLSSVFFWMVVVATLALKQFVVYPRLISHLKSTFASREEAKRHRLRQTLEDPLLRSILEKRLSQEAIDELRTQSIEEVEPEVETKGKEKMLAAKLLYRGTILVTLLLFCAINLLPAFGVNQPVLAFDGTSSYRVQQIHIQTPSSRYISATRLANGPRPVAISRMEPLSSNKKRRLDQSLDAEEWCTEDLHDFRDTYYCSLFCLIHLCHSFAITWKTRGKGARTKKVRDVEQAQPQEDTA